MTFSPHNLDFENWNQKGFFPGPNENEKAFTERVTYCLNLREHLNFKKEIELPFSEEATSSLFIQDVIPQTQQIYGIAPDWVLLFFSNYQLTFWHGGCAWIFQLDNTSPLAAFLQLRSHFRFSPTYLKIYQRNELLVHELAHIGRMAYEEPQFEEFFAYQSSSSWFRRYFGPIIQSSKETLLFILLLGLMIMIDFALLASNHAIGSEIVWGIKFIPAALFLTAFGRLFYRHTIFNRCQRHLETLYSPQQARHFMYRLCDNEIHLFANFSKKQIIDYIEKAKQHSFRWYFLHYLYPY